MLLIISTLNYFELSLLEHTNWLDLTSRETLSK